jgi:hypothetical protein
LRRLIIGNRGQRLKAITDDFSEQLGKLLVPSSCFALNLLVKLIRQSEWVGYGLHVYNMYACLPGFKTFCTVSAATKATKAIIQQN